MRAGLFERAIERTLRGLYSAALYVLLPVTLYHLVWRGFRQRAYLLRWHERYARYGDAPAPDAPHLWVHAVSVGEVNAAAPLIHALLRERPDRRVLVTTITPTGSERVKALWGDRVAHVYLPYDLTGAVSRFLRRFRPQAGLIVETELWPNLLFACRDHGVPTYLVNARLSERSLRGYRVLRPLVGRALRTFRTVAAQSEGDADRFARLGARPDQLAVLGNLKYDVRIDFDGIAHFAAAFRAAVPGRPTWIAASTHPDEEAYVLAIDRQLRARWPDLLLLWAPRHPERFRPVTQLAIDAGLPVATRTLTVHPDGDDAVFVIDTLGELQSFYACADVAFVGGSLVPVGGHSLLEPASMGLPVIAGPWTQNAREVAGLLAEVGALATVRDGGELAARVLECFDHPDAARADGDRARAAVAANRGAVGRVVEMLLPLLRNPEPGPASAAAAGREWSGTR